MKDQEILTLVHHATLEVRDELYRDQGLIIEKQLVDSVFDLVKHCMKLQVVEIQGILEIEINNCDYLLHKNLIQGQQNISNEYRRASSILSRLKRELELLNEPKETSI